MNIATVKKGLVAVAMSGGVDSATTAALLTEQGYSCIGIFMHYWSDPTGVESRRPEQACCSVPNYEDVRRVCDRLGMPLYTFNLDREFKREVVDTFIADYASGRTPNPCINCNRTIKFGEFWNRAQQLGVEYLATGHYVKQRIGRDGKQHLYMATDGNKDQSYFLYTLPQATLAHTIFPVGEYTKPQVRHLAEQFHLSVAQKAESADVCFVKEKEHNQFLQRHIATLKSGEIVTVTGRVIGHHLGLPLYTPGQRKGIGLSGGPWYVVKADWPTNRLIVTNKINDPALYQKTFTVIAAHWIAGEPPRLPLRCRVKVRYRGAAVPAVVRASGTAGRYLVTLRRPERAISTGQSAVFYRWSWHGTELLGGGVIETITN